MRVPLSVIGKVIGQGGGTVKEMQARTGCNITQDKKQVDTADRVFVLHGSPDAVAEAERLIGLKVQSNGARQPASPVGGGDRNSEPQPSSGRKKKKSRAPQALQPVPSLFVNEALPPASPKRFSGAAYTNAPPPAMLPLPVRTHAL